MKEKCELCGETVDDTQIGFGACVDCCEKAVELAMRIKAWESVEIRKVNGEWPFVGAAFGLVEFYNMKLNLALRNTFPEAAAEWNDQARDDGKERGGK